MAYRVHRLFCSFCSLFNDGLEKFFCKKKEKIMIASDDDEIFLSFSSRWWWRRAKQTHHSLISSWQDKVGPMVTIGVVGFCVPFVLSFINTRTSHHHHHHRQQLYLDRSIKVSRPYFFSFHLENTWKLFSVTFWGQRYSCVCVCCVWFHS